MTVEEINQIILDRKGDPSFRENDICDGYHTFAELYEVRHLLFMALLNSHKSESWRASRNADGQKWEGWFVCGIYPEPGQQITFHLPERLWGKLDGIETHDINPYFDGHTGKDVLDRLSNLLKS